MDSQSHYSKFFEEEVHPHFVYLQKFIMTATRDRTLATEIAQEAMAVAWEKVHRISQYRDVKRGLRTIAKNKLYDHYRRNKAQRTFTSLSNVCDKLMAEEDGLVRLIRREERQTLLSAIGGLAPESMQIILLRYYYNQSFRDVAKMTNINYNTVLSRHRRALKVLEEQLRTEKHKDRQE